MRCCRDETIPGRLSRPLAAGPGRRAGTSGGRPHLWRPGPDHPPLAAAAARDRERGAHGHVRGRQRHIGRAAEPALREQVRAAPGRDAGRALCAVGRLPRASPSAPPPCRGRLRGCGCRSKKVPDRRRTRRGRAAGLARRRIAAIAPQRFVFLDETATPTTLTRLRARAPRGQRAIGRVPRKRWQSVTLLASITTAGHGRGHAARMGHWRGRALTPTSSSRCCPPSCPGRSWSSTTSPVHKSAAGAAADRGGGLRSAASCRPTRPTSTRSSWPSPSSSSTCAARPARTFAGLVAATGPALDGRHRRRCPRLLCPLWLPPVRSTLMNNALAQQF